MLFVVVVGGGCGGCGSCYACYGVVWWSLLLVGCALAFGTVSGCCGAIVSPLVAALNGLPALSLPLTLASSVVSAARSLPGTAILKTLPASTVPA